MHKVNRTLKTKKKQKPYRRVDRFRQRERNRFITTRTVYFNNMFLKFRFSFLPSRFAVGRCRVPP